MGTHRRERTMMVQIFGRTGVWTGLRAHRGVPNPSPAVSLRPAPVTPKARRTRYLPAPSSHLPVAEFRRSPCAIMCRTMPDAGRTRRSGHVSPGAGHAGGARRGPCSSIAYAWGYAGRQCWFPAVSCPRRQSPVHRASACGPGSNLSPDLLEGRIRDMDPEEVSRLSIPPEKDSRVSVEG